MTAPYAVSGDLNTWLGAATVAPGAAEATRLLTRATLAIDKALIGATYNVDGTGMPTDAATIQAFNDACCAQVEWWLQNGDEFGDGANVAGYSIEGASVTFRDKPPRLAPRARDILNVVGILPSITPIHLP